MGKRKIFAGAALSLGAFLILGAGVANAAQGDCAQPLSNGAKPTASDCLFLLKAAVGGQDCDPSCICDADGSGRTTATDALLCLKFAVGGDQELACDCGENINCTSSEFFALAGSDLDSGWNGIGHNNDIIEGASITFRTLRRCDGGTGDVCEVDADCPGQDCEPTCNCGDDPECEIIGPTHQKRCVTTLTECDSSADCPAGVSCSNTFGPPLPLSSGGTPVCIISIFDGDLTGTANSATGEGVAKVNLRSRVFLGIDIAQPCPRCGPPSSNPEVGDMFTCEGGQTPGAACTVEAVSPDFGGTSHTCAPELGGAVTGQGIAIRFSEVTTGTAEKQATLPCASFLHRNNPANGGATCLDNGASCSSNDDCLRCDNDLSVCTSNGDCGGGTCGAAPDQPVSCGFYCHCGFCDDDPDLPCFETSDCDEGQVCVVGTGNDGPDLPQQQPNECSADAEYICGKDFDESCPNNIIGRCSEESFRLCSSDNSCQIAGAGTCVFDFTPCFENKMSRTGAPSPLGNYCFSDPGNTEQCTNNDDCAGDDFCVENSSRPTTVALFCVPATSSGTVNNAGGITGPGAIQFNSFVQVCSCGDGEIGCDETCDDSNRESGDGCDENCQTE